MPVRSRAIAAVLVAGLAATACACGKSDQEQVRQVVEDYIQALSTGSFDAACELFTPRYRRQLGGAAACAEAQADQFGGSGAAKAELELSRVRVKGEHANATLNVSRNSGPPSPLAVLLALDENDHWRIRGEQ
jgi:hypothetical protein